MGFLAAAAWFSGGVALEEYKWDKTAGKGRSDLYVCLDGKEFHYEAKRYRVPFNSTDSKSYLTEVENRLKEAVYDAGNIVFEEKEGGGQLIGDRKPCYGVLFVLPFKKGIFTEEEKHQVVNSLCDISCDAMGWYFPKDDTLLRPAKDEITFGGVILIIQRHQ